MQLAFRREPRLEQSESKSIVNTDKLRNVNPLQTLSITVSGNTGEQHVDKTCLQPL